MLGLEVVKKRVKRPHNPQEFIYLKIKKISRFILEKLSILKEDSLIMGIYPNSLEDFKRWYPKLSILTLN